MKILLLAVLASLAAPWANAQKLQLNFESLSAKAKEKAEVDLDGAALAAVLKAAGDKKDAGEGFLAGVKGVFVRHYEFSNPGAYADSDLEPLRKQIGNGASGWSRIVNVKDHEESTEIYLLSQGAAAGLLIIAAEAKELTVVQIDGAVDLGKIAQVQELVESRIKYDLAQAAK